MILSIIYLFIIINIQKNNKDTLIYHTHIYIIINIQRNNKATAW